MASLDSSFNASGPTNVAFETIHANAQEIGVGVIGTKCGVHGEAKEDPAQTKSPRAVEMGTGVHGDGDRAGVFGQARTLLVPGGETCGIGVVGAAQANRGGVFMTGKEAARTGKAIPKQLVEANVSSDDPVAQVHLVPIPAQVLPKDALAGDLLVRQPEEQGDAELWFCVRSPSSGQAAVWKRVSLV